MISLAKPEADTEALREPLRRGARVSGRDAVRRDAPRSRGGIQRGPDLVLDRSGPACPAG